MVNWHPLGTIGHPLEGPGIYLFLYIEDDYPKDFATCLKVFVDDMFFDANPRVFKNSIPLVFSHILRWWLGVHYHSQDLIRSLGMVIHGNVSHPNPQDHGTNMSWTLVIYQEDGICLVAKKNVIMQLVRILSCYLLAIFVVCKSFIMYMQLLRVAWDSFPRTFSFWGGLGGMTRNGIRFIFVVWMSPKVFGGYLWRWCVSFCSSGWRYQETLGRCLSLRYYENVLFAFSQTSHDHNVPLYQWFVKRIRFQYRYV